MDKNYVVATVKPWNTELFFNNYADKSNFRLVNAPGELTLLLTGLHNRGEKVRYIFFPHWCWKIPDWIVKRYECVIFHMTDLPFGRGPEPLQHLIDRGIKQTTLTALRADEGMDTGPVYFKLQGIPLEGTAENIYAFVSKAVYKMIDIMIADEPTPKPQDADASGVVFPKQTEDDYVLPLDDKSIEVLYDHIRAHDAETYQPSFIEHSGYRIEFTNACMRYNRLEGHFVIKRRTE
jgi:methionyl-tRNA formyltransferase